MAKKNTRVSGVALFGPAARRFVSPDRWTDGYPATPEYAKEFEVLLSFADDQGRLPQFIPRLESKNTQRDEALDELRVAYFLHHSQFPVVQWEPPGLNGKVGEYLIDTPEGRHVFVEVKSPGWEGELSDEERNAGRAKQAKYQNGEGGAFGNWLPLQKCIASPRTYPKFLPTQPNLLIIADDLKMSLQDSLDHVEIAMYATHDRYGETGYFTSARFENLGGVGIFRALSEVFPKAIHCVEYEFKLFDNPFALPSVRLPESLLKLKTHVRRAVRGTVVAPSATFGLGSAN